MFFQCINICQVPWEVLKTEAEGVSGWFFLLLCFIDKIHVFNENSETMIRRSGSKLFANVRFMGRQASVNKIWNWRNFEWRFINSFTAMVDNRLLQTA